ncbi:hypothetical protein ACVWYO_000142 [Sphingomonas sp. UYP23]
MIAFFIVLAVVTAGGVWATESVDRPRRRKLREAAIPAE